MVTMKFLLMMIFLCFLGGVESVTDQEFKVSTGSSLQTLVTKYTVEFL